MILVKSTASTVILLAALVSACACARKGTPTPTFARDIAPIVFKHCAPCHRPGQGAPFTLLSYEDVRRRTDKVAHATSMRHMPPWLPDPSEPGFVGERRLSDAEIGTITRWVEQGAVEGDPRDMPAAPAAITGWQMGEPDLVVTPARPFLLRKGGDDVFRNLVIGVPIAADRFVRAVEFLPGSAPVHHAVLHLDRTSASRRLDAADGQPGFDGMGAMGAQEPDGHFLGWAPGRGPIVSADGMPWRLARGTDLVLELHLIPRTADIEVRPSVGLYFAAAPAASMPLMLKMGSKAIDIPAGARDYAIGDSYQLPADVDLLSLYPHAHFLGKDMLVQATRPDGPVITLLHIRRWSFHWQQDYRYVRPVTLNAGWTISMRFTYDNSDDNEDNPHHPPIPVTAGQRSTDEMGNLLLQVVPHSAADRARLVRDFARKEILANIAGGEMVARHHPDNAENRAFLGGSYVDAGRIAEGITELERALKLDPKSARAHNELGGALLEQQRVLEAVAHFQRAVSLAPEDGRLIYNLGKAFGAAGRAAEARRAFERALAVSPDLGEAHDELGVLLFADHRLDEAIAHLQRAAELLPDSAVAHSDLGGALAQAGQRDRALAEVRRALEIDPGHEPARENLARLTRPSGKDH